MKLSKLFNRMTIACFITVLLALLPAICPAAPEQPGRPEPAPVPIMEQRALDQLKRMSATLGAARAFTYRSRSTVEIPAKTGQFITLFGASEVALQRPNKLRVHVTGEVPNFLFYYDGTNITAFAPKDNVYSQTSAPDTIDAMLKSVEEKTGIHFPSADVMFSDPYGMMTKDVTSAFVVGPATVDGVPVRAPGLHGSRDQLGNLDRYGQESASTASGGNLHRCYQLPPFSSRIL